MNFKIPDLPQYYRQVRFVLIITLFLNLFVSIAKLIVGYMANSMSLIADGIHSFSDGMSNITGLIGISLASRPRDATHPYGHQKFETIAALAISIMLVLVSLNILYSAINRLMNPVSPDVTIISFAVIIFTIIVNVFVSRYEFKEGTRLKSDILLSDSAHTGSDVLVSLTVLISLIASYFGFSLLDSIASLLIALLILKVAFQIFTKNAHILTDHAVLNPEDIERLVSDAPGVKTCHNIRTRGMEDHIFVDLHLTLSGNTTVFRQHEIVHHVEDKIKTHIPGVKEVYIHIEPVETELWPEKD
ncbi:cation transporter [Methanocella sp. CWC-04]|uniref:Cation transporter n=1 Tax=Methanooceanicella nereidis TaxID=2052831 RepID=A0AAP2RBC4_9EURY|nr:cation diffusion facilitator family transporter [Methanocella sp. CWC-04]MCD1294188.1 cation transporter [Methanocella sp. CWC-04]